MTRLDDEIRQALSEEEKTLFDELGADMTMNQLMTGPFRTRMRWWSAYAFFLSFAFFALTVWCGWHFFRAEEATDRIFWGICALASLLPMSMLKLWFFMETNRLSIVREIRRVELQLAALANRQ
jgi:hypothetical protein